MSTSIDKATEVAKRVEAKAVDTLAGLEREMNIMKWSPEFRAIMWSAVAHEAMKRAYGQTLKPEDRK